MHSNKALSLQVETNYDLLLVNSFVVHISLSKNRSHIQQLTIINHTIYIQKFTRVKLAYIERGSETLKTHVIDLCAFNPIYVLNCHFCYAHVIHLDKDVRNAISDTKIVGYTPVYHFKIAI